MITQQLTKIFGLDIHMQLNSNISFAYLYCHMDMKYTCTSLLGSLIWIMTIETSLTCEFQKSAEDFPAEMVIAYQTGQVDHIWQSWK